VLGRVELEMLGGIMALFVFKPWIKNPARDRLSSVRAANPL